MSTSLPAGQNELSRNCLACVAFDKALSRRLNPKGKMIHGETILSETQENDKKEVFRT